MECDVFMQNYFFNPNGAVSNERYFLNGLTTKLIDYYTEERKKDFLDVGYESDWADVGLNEGPNMLDNFDFN